MKPKVVFLCGDHSPYGWAHCEPILASFDVRLVVFAAPTVWAKFRNLGSPSKIWSANPVGSKFSWMNRLIKDVRESQARSHRRKKLSKLGICTFVATDVNAADCLRAIERAAADYLVTAAYPQILKAPLLAHFPRGAVNFHPSLLPRYRGAHPHYWCIARGESESGVTSHLMTTGIDDGPIIEQIRFPLGNDSYPELYEKLIDTTPALIRRTAMRLATPGFTAIPQDETDATCFHQDTYKDHQIRWEEMDGWSIVNHVRAGHAWTLHKNHVVIIQRAILDTDTLLECDADASPGRVLSVGTDAIRVCTRDGATLHITQSRYHLGPLRMKMRQMRYLIRSGEVLGDP